LKAHSATFTLTLGVALVSSLALASPLKAQVKLGPATDLAPGDGDFLTPHQIKLWDGDELIPLPTFKHRMRFVDINEKGTIVAHATDSSSSDGWIVWWDAEQRLHVLGQGVPTAVNESDVVAGYKLLPPDPALPLGVRGTKAFLFDLRKGIEIELEGLPGETGSTRANDINNAGIAVGVSGGRGVIFPAYRPERAGK